MLRWLVVVLLVMGTVYAALLAALLLCGRRTDARVWSRFVPDCVVLFGRLLRDRSVPKRRRAVLVLMLAYLASRIDLIPDFIPVFGQLDDALVIFLALRYLLRGTSRLKIEEH